MEAIPYKLENLVKPGEEVTIQLTLLSPKLSGKYCAFFRFVHGENQRFGQKVWCDILVTEKIEPSKLEKLDVSIESFKPKVE